MAKAKKKREVLPPLVVGKDSQGKDVTLSDRVQRDILAMPAGKSRDDLRALRISQAMASAENKIKYYSQRDNLQFVPSKDDEGNPVPFLWVRGTGTKFSGCFSKQQGIAMIENFGEFKAAILALPDAVESTEDSTEDAE